MKYKMLVLDLDDTLLLPDGSLSEETKISIKKVQEKGVKVVLASGRPEQAIHHLSKELELDKYGSFIISFNGSKIINCRTKEVIYEDGLDKAQLENLFDLSREHDCFIHTYIGDEIVTTDDNPYTYIESEITKMPIKMVDDLKKELPDRCIKAIMLQNPEHLKEVREILKPKTKDMYMTISKPFFLEFMNKGVDKGKAILRLCEKLGVPIDSVMAIGDSYNDESMLKAAGLSIAMENAVDEIKELSDFVTKSNIENGVSFAIEKFIL